MSLSLIVQSASVVPLNLHLSDDRGTISGLRPLVRVRNMMTHHVLDWADMQFKNLDHVSKTHQEMPDGGDGDYQIILDLSRLNEVTPGQVWLAEYSIVSPRITGESADVYVIVETGLDLSLVKPYLQ